MWCFNNINSLKDGVWRAENIGNVADLTAAIEGQIGAAFCGFENIPSHEQGQLVFKDEILKMAMKLPSAGIN
ncbi:ADP-ribosylglycohydrolase family protein [Reinekea sp. G2M2-21]|uniref:ADP-ribosylglycohydrolase family protein n=1 Tax=Reinekea sp. G2M2-21 TaxID=2788942 RepID=UPI00351C266B